jgi:hypothetical protein
MKALLILGTLPCVMLFASTVPTLSAQSEKTYVTIDDIGSSVVVLGRLGVPLRTMVRFKAKWIHSPDRSKPELIPLRLNIIEIDGKPLERDVLFLPADVDVVDSTGQEKIERELHREVSLYGYEDWVTYGPPVEFHEAIGKPPASPQARGRTQLKAIAETH